jgi:ubiquinone/menaquinone biosynthesis C-methylase UbiE
VVGVTAAATDEAVWAAEPYAEIATEYLPMAGLLVEHVGVQDGDRVLDVGCGTGNVAITAARRGATVTGLDVTPSMLDAAAQNAERAGVEGLTWREGDGADLPFADGAFDATVSALGHMYADPPADATAELLRVTRSGGAVGFTAWTPTSLYPSLAGILTTAVPPAALPEFSEPPFLWGDAGTIERRLGDRVDSLAVDTETVWYAARSPTDFLEHTATHSRLFADVFGAVDDDDRQEVRDRLVDAIADRFDGRRNAVELEYLLATATVR